MVCVNMISGKYGFQIYISIKPVRDCDFEFDMCEGMQQKNESNVDQYLDMGRRFEIWNKHVEKNILGRNILWRKHIEGRGYLNSQDRTP